MAVTVNYYTETKANYDWLNKTDGFAVKLNQDLATWIAAINANPSQSGRQVVLEEDHNSGTGNYVGFVVSLPCTGATIYASTFSTSASNRAFQARDTWTAGASNGGYGSFSGSGVSDTSMGWQLTGDAAIQMVAYNTVDGEEWFAVSWELTGSGNGTYDCVIIAKNSFGEWTAIGTDGTSIAGCSRDSSTTCTSNTKDSNIQQYLRPRPGISLYNASVTGNNSGVYLATPDLWTGSGGAGNSYGFLGYAYPISSSYYLLSLHQISGYFVRYPV